MNPGKPSQTAAFVATWRALGETLPPGAALCTDPLGWSFSPPATAWLAPVARRLPRVTGRLLMASPLRRLLLWMQLRTRCIDDVCLDFVRGGGRQIVLLGAGFDSRSVRLDLADALLLEVDHPATQARKRALIDARGLETRSTYVPWDFERDPLADLPASLENRGLDPARPTLTLSEGVVMYLTEPAVEATLAAVRAYSAPASQILIHYIERRLIHRRTVYHWVARRVGEPMQFGWDVAELPGWLAARGFDLVSDRGDEALARELFAPEWAESFGGAGGRIAVARPRR